MTELRPTTFGPGAMCAKFRIEKLLGRGGMGEVYLALDTFLGRKVALKVLPFKRSVDPSFQNRMQREAAAGARIDHPNVTRILDGGATDNHVFYVVMELLENMRTLRALCHRIELPLDAGLIISIQIAEGLSAVHAAGITHRDLKPENVAVLPGGIVKIIDFGLAKVRSEWIRTSFDPSRPEQRMGTAHYMAPEQIDNRKDDIGPRSDVYALGCILFEVFSGGRHVFQLESGEFPEQMAALFAHMTKVPPRLDTPERDVEGRTPKPLADLVDRCLAKDVRARPEADEIARALRKILEAVKLEPVSSSAHTARTAVPTDAVISRAVSMPHIDLPPASLPTDRDPVPAFDRSRPNVVTPEAVTPEPWQQRASSPVGFVPVLGTELLLQAARPTLQSPEPAKRLPKRTVPMSQASHARAASQAALTPRSAPPPVLPTEPDVHPPMGPKPQEPVAKVSVAGPTNVVRKDEPQRALAYLWARRLSFAGGLLLALVLFVTWEGVIRPALWRGRQRASSSASPREATPDPGASAAPGSTTPAASSSTDPSPPTTLASSRVSPAGSARSFPAAPHSGQSPWSWPPGPFAPHAPGGPR